MPLRFNICPHCNKKIIFNIEKDDVDHSRYPTPFYLHHVDKLCDKTSTFFVDSLLQVAYKELELKKSKSELDIKTIETQ